MYNQFVIRLKKISTLTGVSQRKMAKQMNMHFNTVARYFRGEVFPSGEFLFALHEHYGININWLISGKGPVFDYAALSQLPVVVESNQGYTTDDDPEEGYLGIAEMENINRLMQIMKRRKSVGKIVAALVDANREARASK